MTWHSEAGNNGNDFSITTKVSPSLAISSRGLSSGSSISQPSQKNERLFPMDGSDEFAAVVDCPIPSLAAHNVLNSPNVHEVCDEYK